MWDSAFVFVSLLWLGILLGVSFLATPVKFQALSLDLPVALEVGRVTFALLMKAEWVAWALLAMAALLARRGLWNWLGMALLAALLLAQTFWLLPVLDARVSLIMAGQAVPPASHHLIYVMVESAKALLLFVLSIKGLRHLTSWKEGMPCA